MFYLMAISELNVLLKIKLGSYENLNSLFRVGTAQKSLSEGSNLGTWSCEGRLKEQ